MFSRGHKYTKLDWQNKENYGTLAKSSRDSPLTIIPNSTSIVFELFQVGEASTPGNCCGWCSFSLSISKNEVTALVILIFSLPPAFLFLIFKYWVGKGETAKHFFFACV